MTEENYVIGLRRLGDKIKKHKLITLSGLDEVTIGRSPNVTVSLLSTMISRCHAVLNKSDDDWKIRDNKSLNGVTVNGKKLSPDVSYTLQEGDVVQFGVPPEGNQQEEFIFQYHKRIKVKRARPKSSEDETDCANPRNKKSPTKYPLKRVKLDTNTENSSNSENVMPSHSGWSPFQQYKEKQAQQDIEAAKKLKDLEVKLAEMQEILKKKEDAQEEMKSKLEEERKQRENQTIEMKEKLKQKEEELTQQTTQMKVKLKEKEEELEKEMKRKKEEENRMREELETQLKQKEKHLKEQLQAQKESLIREKEKIEESLQDTMAKALEEKDKKLQEEMMQTKHKLEMVIQQKETEQKMLESQLNETKEENDKQKEAMLHARQDILANFADLMETELQCTICNELYVQATSLSCSHSFCALCISQWMKVKKECPICRSPITSQMRSIALDNYIDTMVEHLSEEMKERRKCLVADRKAEQAEIDKANQTTASTTGNTRGRGRGRGRRRGGREGNTTTTTTTVNLQGHRPIIVEEESEPIEVSSDVEMSSSDSESDRDSDRGSDSSRNSSEDSDYIPGEPGAYYGGYGACYRCGSRGHWANGCPFR